MDFVLCIFPKLVMIDPMPRRNSGNSTKASPAPRNTVKVTSGPFVDSQAAFDFLNSRINFEQLHTTKLKPESFKLDRMQALVETLGDPHLAVPVVHVAGSKGKGSTCAMLESCLRSSGYTTGLFTSPHLTDERERVRINGVNISKDLFVEALSVCKDAALTIEKQHGPATYFELITALSFVVFAQQAVDIVIMETGLGGRLDCTNVVKPMVVGLTNIQLEHTAVLGDTLEKIATEKAGIMKSGVPAISVPQDEQVIEVFRKRAEEVDCPFQLLGEDLLYSCRFQSAPMRGPHPKVCIGEGEGCFEHMSVPLLGEHQGANCGLALAIILELRKHGFDLPEQQIIAGLEHTPREGRLEQVNARPSVFIDGAHTPESVRETLNAAAQQVSFDSLILIFGCSSDKQIDNMLTEFRTRVDKVIFTKASENPRAVNPADLAQRYTELNNRSCESYPDATQAIQAAGKTIGPNDLLLIMGSFYLAGEVKALFKAKADASTDTRY
jgi:dihydrofolate synthase / folylpolyglutamate synthase